MILSKVYKTTFAALAIAFAASAFAIDYGGALNNSSKLKGKNFSNLKIDQLDDLSAWVKVPIKADGSMYFTAEGLYEFELDDTNVYNRLDLDLCKFQANFKIDPYKLSVSAGRFSYSDITGIILNQRADGAYANFEAQKFSVSLYAAYTGLLNAALVKMNDHPADAFKHDKKAVYELAQKYFLTSATFLLPRLFTNQNFAAQVMGAFKLDGKSYNRIYASAGFNGPIYKTLFYNASTTFAMQSFDGSMDLANLTCAKVSWFLPYKDLTLNGGVVYASGSHGPFEGFSAFSKIDAYNALNEPQYSGLLKFSFSASAKPIGVVLVYGGMDLIINAASSSMKYKGFQYNLGADWQIFSDLKAGLNFSQYIDSDNSDLSKVQFSLNASIIF